MPKPEVGATAADRIRAASRLRRPSRGQFLAGALMAALGFAAVAQITANDDESRYSSYRQQELIDVLNDLASTSQRAQSEITRLEQARTDLQSSTSQRQSALEAARTEVDTLAILAGSVPVRGPGVRIMITEADVAINVDAFIDLIQELRSVGAEAMQINREVRVVAQTSFDQVPGGLMVDGVIVESPYTVDAIGEPETLTQAVVFARGPADAFERDGASVKVSQRDSLVINSVRAQ